MTNKLLLDEEPLVIIPSLAKTFGLNESIILQQLHYWLQRSQNVEDGHIWVYNTYEDWNKQFPFWSISTIRRVITKLENQKVIIVDNFNKLKIDKTKWYRLNYDAINGMNSPCVQNEQSSCSKRNVHEPNLNIPLPEITSENSFASAADTQTREGESDGVLTTDPSSGDQQNVVEISHTPDAERALLDHFISLRAYGFDASADDIAAAKEILSSGVLLEDALNWLSDKFRRYKPKHPRDRINSLSYCVGFILDKHVEKIKLSEDEEHGKGEEVQKSPRGVRRSTPKTESITGNQVGRFRRKTI